VETTYLNQDELNVLLVDNNEDDYVLTRDLLADIGGFTINLDWVPTYDDALKKLALNRHDVCLIDYRLGARTGIDLIGEAMQWGCQAPLILLTGQGNHEIDMQAMRAGASDYLVKGQVDAVLLERSIRYAIERNRM